MAIPKDEGITAEDVRRILNYNPETGEFTWREYRSSNARPGDKAGYYSPEFKYITVRIGRLYLAHRLAWLHYYGEWPTQYLDHINGDCADNRISNLREATKSENGWNAKKRKTNKSGFRGVSLYRPNGKWRARITANKIERSLGYFDTKEEAVEAYKNAAQELYGEFAR